MAIKVFNSLHRQKEEFIPNNPQEVSIYACGITPYNYAHIGNSRPAVFWDCVRRFLIYRGYGVKYIQNFTDVDDKIIKSAAEQKEEPLALSRRFADIYLEDLKDLGVLPADKYPRVSEHIPEIIEMVQTLIDKGFAYEVNGDVYYEVGKFKEYGKLSGRNLEDLQAGARVEINEVKRNPMDFALWKAAKPGEISWDSPWGQGRPGWHIECSAMSIKYLGKNFDMHGGGEDLVFPHHENEIAQSEAYLGGSFAKYWLHNAFVTVRGERMGKSMGNFSTIRAVINEYSPKVVRFWLVGTHYRNPIGFGEEEFTAAARGLERLETARFNWEHILKQPTVSGNGDSEIETVLRPRLVQTKEDFIAGMEDDFNTPQALAALYELVREMNRWTQAKEFVITEGNQMFVKEALSLLLELGGLLGLFDFDESDSKSVNEDDERIESMLAQRTQAKKDKNWALADQIRDELKAEGIVIEDTPQGARWKRENQ